MARISDISQLAILGLLGAYTTGKPVLAINLGGAATVKTTGAINATINGVALTRPALAAQSLVVTHDSTGAAATGYIQPAGVTTYYTLAVNAAGSVAVVQGFFAGQRANQDPTVGVGAASMSGVSFAGFGLVPDVPAGFAPFGVIKVVTAGVATLTPNVTALDAANVTATYFDVNFVPGSNL